MINNKKSGILKGALILTIAGMVTKCLGFVFRIYLSGKIGAQGMGLYQLIIPLYMLMGTVTASGISIAVSKMVAEEVAKRQDGNARRVLRVSMSMTAVLGCAVGIFVFFFAEFIGEQILREPQATLSILYLAPCVPFMAVCACLHGYYLGLGEMEKPALTQVLEQCARMLIIYFIIGFWTQKGLSYACAAAVLGITAGEVIACIYIYILYRRGLQKKQKRQKPAISLIHCAGGILAIALPITASRTVSAALHMAENILIPGQLQRYGLTHAQAMSTFGMLKGMVIPLLFFPSALLTSLAVSLVPAVSQASATGDRGQMYPTISKSLRFAILTGFLVVCIFLTFSYELGNAIYKSSEVGQMLSAYSFICPFIYVEFIVAGILNGLGEQMTIFKNSLIESAISLIFVIFLIPIFGFWAYLLGISIGAVINVCLNFHRLLCKTCLVFDYKNWILRPALAAALAGACCYAIGRTVIFPHFSLGAGVFLAMSMLSLLYLLFLCLLGSIKKSEFWWIWARFSKSRVHAKREAR